MDLPEIRGDLYRGKKEREREKTRMEAFYGTWNTSTRGGNMETGGKKRETAGAESGKIAWLRGNTRFSAANRIS